jgi:hypothetical protein
MRTVTVTDEQARQIALEDQRYGDGLCITCAEELDSYSIHRGYSYCLDCKMTNRA